MKLSILNQYKVIAVFTDTTLFYNYRLTKNKINAVIKHSLIGLTDFISEL